MTGKTRTIDKLLADSSGCGTFMAKLIAVSFTAGFAKHEHS
jgi:hypothetical protein